MALKDIEDRVDYYDAHIIRELDGWIKDAIHRDMHLGNLVFDNNRFNGYLDFDISQKNARIFDICYLGASMLVGNYTDRKKLQAWNEIFRGVIDGYQSINKLGGNELAASHMMFVLIEVIFAAFFAQLNQLDVSKSCVEMTNWLYEKNSLTR
ncbi:MAG TPA: phosphotransferase [Clostridia bacterium]|nr:phosphotransferase [Clostridia bacterium]